MNGVSAVSPEQFESLLPLASAWTQDQEGIALRLGVPLSASEMNDARTVGVAHPDRVRLLRVQTIPMPDHPRLRAAAEATQLISPLTGGLTVRYGIFIHADWWRDRRLVVHELVHTSQYERRGGFEPFLQHYLSECLLIGYPNAPMEREAIETAARVCG